MSYLQYTFIFCHIIETQKYMLPTYKLYIVNKKLQNLEMQHKNWSKPNNSTSVHARAHTLSYLSGRLRGYATVYQSPMSETMGLWPHCFPHVSNILLENVPMFECSCLFALLIVRVTLCRYNIYTQMAQVT